MGFSIRVVMGFIMLRKIITDLRCLVLVHALLWVLLLIFQSLNHKQLLCNKQLQDNVLVYNTTIMIISSTSEITYLGEILLCYGHLIMLFILYLSQSFPRAHWEGPSLGMSLRFTLTR